MRIVWYNDHMDQITENKRAYVAAYRVSHREQLTAQKRIYRKTHPRDYARQRQQQAGFTAWLQILRHNLGCRSCDTHDGLLQHHHRDPSTKRFNISQMAHCSINTLRLELEKCDVLCQSCHTKLDYT